MINTLIHVFYVNPIQLLDRLYVASPICVRQLFTDNFPPVHESINLIS